MSPSHEPDALSELAPRGRENILGLCAAVANMFLMEIAYANGNMVDLKR
jgi:hypothetical protein